MTLLVVIAVWGWAFRRPAASDHAARLASRLADGAHGEAVSSDLVELRVTVAGRREAAVQVAEGEMARIETAKSRLGMQARQAGGRLTLVVSRLETLGSGESATSIGSYSLDSRSETAQIDVNGEPTAVTWSGPLASPHQANREPCCMVCGGVTICGQVVSANCGSCRGKERASQQGQTR